MDDNEDLRDFITNQEAKSTKYSNTTAKNFVKKYMMERGDEREIEDVPPEELSKIVAFCFKNAKKANGDYYEPDCLSTYFRGLKRYLDNARYPVNICKSDIFELCREVIAAKRKSIKKQGGGSRPRATRELSDEEEDTLWKEKYFSDESPISLRNAMWWLLSLHFGFRANNEQGQLKWGDVELGYDNVEGKEFLKWKLERRTKTRNGKSGEKPRVYPTVAYATKDARCPVKYYKIYRERRPFDAREATSPFFLAIDHKHWNMGKIWFSKFPAGVNKINEVLRVAKKEFGFEGNISNHSVRKTSIGRLLDAGVSDVFVAQQHGMKNTDSLKSYKVPGQKHKVQMSNILSRQEPDSRPTDRGRSERNVQQLAPSSTIVRPEQIPPSHLEPESRPTQPSSQATISSMISSAGSFSQLKDCTFNFNFGTVGGLLPPDRPTKRRRILIRDK